MVHRFGRRSLPAPIVLARGPSCRQLPHRGSVMADRQLCAAPELRVCSRSRPLRGQLKLTKSAPGTFVRHFGLLLAVTEYKGLVSIVGSVRAAGACAALE